MLEILGRRGRQTQKTKHEKAPPQTLTFPLNNNQSFDTEEILKHFERQGGIQIPYWYHPKCSIISFDEGKKIQTTTEHYKDTHRQAFSRNNNMLTVSCNCVNKKLGVYCNHLLEATQFVAQVLGENALSETFIDDKKREHLAQFGFSLDDDYSPYFSFYIDNSGFCVDYEQDNLIPIIAATTPDLPPLLPETLAVKQKRERGIGLIFEYDGRHFVELSNISAKYDKTGKELYARFEKLFEHNLGDLSPSKREREVFYLSRQIDALLSSRTIKPQAIALFSELCGLLDDYPIFSHPQNKSYTRKNMNVLRVDNNTPIALFFQTKSDSFCYQLTAKIRLGYNVMQINSPKLKINPLFILCDNVIYPLRDVQLSADIGYYQELVKLAFPKTIPTQFEKQVLTPLSKRYEVQGSAIKKAKKTKKKAVTPAKTKPESTPQANAPERQIYVSESDAGLVHFRLAIQYPDKLIDVHSHEMRLKLDDKGNFANTPRDNVLEQDFIDTFEALHDNFKGAPIYAVTPQQLIEDFWFLETASQLQADGVKILGTKNLKSFNYNLNKPTANMSLKSDIDWFDVELDIAFGDQHVSLKDLQKSFVKKQNYIELGDGTIGMLPEKWLAQFEQYFKVGEVKKDHIRLSNFHFGVIDTLYEELDDKPEFLVDLYERKQRLKDLHLQADVKKTRGLKAELRPYQQHGLNWLNFLHENRLGGCLADDMGLGKTLQTIAFLQHLKITQKPQQPSIIVAPTSLIFNWIAEVKKFCPTLKTLNFTGANRAESLDKFDNVDIVLTTYGSLLKDIDILKELAFHYAILDESQAIKNPQSKRYKAVRLLRAYNRLILTGTPIENNTFDLYAQFNFLNPGLLGNLSNFRSEFSEAIDKNKDISASELLSKLVNPFILRRTKEQVATELPPKIESVMYCEMGARQRQIYETVKDEYRNNLLGIIAENGIEKSQMHILDGLMKLRQICNSPAILGGAADYGDESAKLELLIDNIKEKTGKHKILVFSSFVKMLKLIQTHLDKEKIRYEYLDGRTRNRQKKVDNFQNSADVRVFLISTKAGGTGLNLTEADYVFIVDPWWNPAVENQAIDRSYRIGQEKHVMAYRMICNNSIEEKILALQEKKKRVADSIISVDEEKKSFDLAEVKRLFD